MIKEVSLIDAKYVAPALDAEGKQVDPNDYGYLLGYASIFGNYDRVGEAVAPGAFKDSIPTFLRDGFGAAGHSWSDFPITTIGLAQEDEKGLLVRMDFHSHGQAQVARSVVQERLARGKSVSLSIGYNVEESEITDKGVVLKKLNLYEISLVNVPANPLATVLSSKSLDADRLLAEQTFEDHSTIALAVMDEYIKRAKSIQGLRTKAGRKLSKATMAKLQNLIDMCQGLLDENTSTMDDGKSVPEQETKDEEVVIEIKDEVPTNEEAHTEDEAPKSDPNSENNDDEKALQDARIRAKINMVKLNLKMMRK